MACLMKVLYLNCLFKVLKKHAIFKILTDIRSANISKILNYIITVKLRYNYTVITVNTVLTSTVLLGKHVT